MSFDRGLGGQSRTLCRFGNLRNGSRGGLSYRNGRNRSGNANWNIVSRHTVWDETTRPPCTPAMARGLARLI